MSQPSKKELSDKELAEAVGGADIDGGGGVRAEGPGAITPTTGYVDEEGVYHEGAIPGSATILSGGGGGAGGFVASLDEEEETQA